MNFMSCVFYNNFLKVERELMTSFFHRCFPATCTWRRLKGINSKQSRWNEGSGQINKYQQLYVLNENNMIGNQNCYMSTNIYRSL